jgi:starvation-inducible DNA-binding protein
MNIDISEQTRQVIADGLSQFLANIYALYVKTQNFHWNVKGLEFFSLHLLFEKQYEEIAEELDVVAERIRAIGFYVDASFSGFKNLTQVKDETKVLSSRDMLLSLIEGHETSIRQGRHVAEIADKEGDFASVDLLGRMLGAHEKMLWMLRSSI